MYSEGQITPKGTAAIARVAPHAAVAYGGKKVYDSDTVRRIRAKYQEHKIKKQMRRAQRGY